MDKIKQLPTFPLEETLKRIFEKIKPVEILLDENGEVVEQGDPKGLVIDSTDPLTALDAFAKRVNLRVDKGINHDNM